MGDAMRAAQTGEAGGSATAGRGSYNEDSSMQHSDQAAAAVVAAPDPDSSAPTPVLDKEESKSSENATPPVSAAPSVGPSKGKDASPSSKGKHRRGQAETAVVSVWTTLYGYVDWFLPVFKNWTKMKPVLRSALTAWLCMICMIISPLEIALGQASFLLLVGCFISPNEIPILGIIEREFFTVLFTTISWAYANLAIFLAHLARRQKLSASESDINLIYTGGYVEAGPTSICAAFLAVGIAFLLYLKVKFGPSPFLFACILSCIALDITLVYAPLYPYPLYTLGQSIVAPLALKAGISIFVSCVFFPKSVNSAFVEKMLAVLQPLSSSTEQLLELLKHSPTDADFNFDMMHNQVTKAEGGLIPLRSSARLITREISFSLAGGEELKSLVQVFVGMLGPADGISYYFSSIKADMHGIDIHRHPHVSKFNTPIRTRPVTPTQQYQQQQQHHHHQSSTPSTPVIVEGQVSKAHEEAMSSALSAHVNNRLRRPTPIRADSPASSIRRHSHELRNRMQNAIHQWHVKPTHHNHHQERVEVGLWESLRYAAVETQLHSRENDRHTEMCFAMLGKVSQNLIQQQRETFQSVEHWLRQLNRQRLKRLRDTIFFMSPAESVQEGENSAEKLEKGTTVKPLRQSIEDLQRAIEEFNECKKSITTPFQNSVEPAVAGNNEEEEERIPHRYLFQCFTFCYFEVQFSSRLLTFAKECVTIDERRTHWRFWFPTWPKLLTIDVWKTFDESDTAQTAEQDEDPDRIPGMVSSLGATKARDPEVMESDTSGGGQTVALGISRFLGQIFKGNSLFMIKAAAVTILVSLPSFLRSSAGWSYENKAIWTVIMSQLSIARHRGEVLFSLASRVVATLLGAIIGMVVWYIASGDGVANPYAMAVVTAFGFVLLMVLRLNMPGPPITAIITCVTAAIVIGYSWKDSHNPTYGSPGVGWDVTWRRFLEVVIGATAAYVVAILPPSSSMRKYFRLSHATTIAEIGGMYCQVVTLAATPNADEAKNAIHQLIAIRAKIRRLMLLKPNITYEWSFRGHWPIKRYEELEQVELQLSKLLSHSITIFENLEPGYARALLRRTHFLDPVFLADCIAILTMCTTALRTGRPLPQIVPVLIDRYLSNAPGFQFRQQNQQQQYHHHQSHTPSHSQPYPQHLPPHLQPQQHGSSSPHDDHHHHHSHTPPQMGGEDDEFLCSLPKVVTYETICKEEYQTFAVGVLVAYGIVLRLDRLCLAVKELVGETYSVPADLHLAGASTLT